MMMKKERNLMRIINMDNIFKKQYKNNNRKNKLIKYSSYKSSKSTKKINCSLINNKNNPPK